VEPHRRPQPAGDRTHSARQISQPQDRCARFLVRLDTHLAALASDAARQSFIDRQLEAWQRRYGRFISMQDGCAGTIETADPPQAADFLLTISALAAKRRTLGKLDQPTARKMTPMTEFHAPAAISGPESKLLDGALLSLLVAADQRCPAIIGQAHLLYHGRPRKHEHAQTTFAQLKRDADDLIRAIAEVEAAMRPYATDVRMG
jgi:hypothetical protein